jgi:hypothetical protein|tara:strand:- start:370 stop:576 length:207 start_codon:yes stop_codon:yes gene_type:complete
MITNPASILYKKMEASLRQDPPKEDAGGFFSRGGLQQGGGKEPAQRVRNYFKRIRAAREEFNNGRTRI